MFGIKFDPDNPHWWTRAYRKARSQIHRGRLGPEEQADILDFLDLAEQRMISLGGHAETSAGGIIDA